MRDLKKHLLDEQADLVKDWERDLNNVFFKKRKKLDNNKDGVNDLLIEGYDEQTRKLEVQIAVVNSIICEIEKTDFTLLQEDAEKLGTDFVSICISVEKDENKIVFGLGTRAEDKIDMSNTKFIEIDATNVLKNL